MPAESVSEEASHLIRDKGYPQKRAVAASLSQARRGKFGRKAQRKARRKRSRG